jgi:hypothetical protein
MKRFILLFSILILSVFAGYAESLRGEHNAWAEESMTLDSDFGNMYSITFLASGTDSNSEFKFAINDWATNWGTGTDYYEAGINSYEGQCRGSNSGDSPGNLGFNRSSGKYYTFRLNGESTWWNRQFMIMETDNAPVTISNVTDNSSSAGEGNVTVSIALSASKSTQEVIYVRYTTDGWSTSSFLEATGSGTDYSADIPGVNGNTTVEYYVLTTTMPLAKIQVYPNLATLRGNNNGGSNYSYSPPCEGITEGKVVIDDGELIYWADDDFNGENLGTFAPGSTLLINSAQIFVYKYACGDIVSSTAYYRIYKQGDVPGSFNAIVTPYESEWTIGEKLHQLWWNDAPDLSNIDVLAACSSDGTYVIEFYFQASNGAKTIYYRNNGGVNYIATFNYYTSTVWTGNTSIDWNTASNWTNGVPSQYLDATIPNGCTNYPFVGPTSNATSNNLIIASDASMDIAYRGSFINHGTITNSGSLNYHLDIPSEEWHLIAMPGAHMSDMFYFNGDPWIYLQSYISSSDGWDPIVPTNTSLSAGTGYSVWVDQDGENGGTFNNQTVTYTNPTIFNDHSQSLSDAGNGYNLICNPFPSDLIGNINAWVKTNVANAMWVWNGTSGNYMTWNGASGNLQGGLIPALQGFFVQATNSGASVTLPSASRIHTYFEIYKNDEWPINTLEIAVDRGDFSDATYISLNDDAQPGIDNVFDVKKFYGKAEAPQLYSLCDGDFLSINGMPFTEGLEIVLGFEAPLNETYSFDFNGIEFFDGIAVVLEDTKNETFTNLSEEESYEFIYEAGDINRFKLSFYSTTNINNAQNESVSIFTYNNQINVYSDKSINKVSIYDISGKKIYEKTCNSRILNMESEFATGIYIISVQTTEEHINKSVYLSR